MGTVDIINTIKHTVKIEDDNYSYTDSKKALLTFFVKIRSLDPESLSKEIKLRVSKKMRCKNNYYLDELYSNALNDISVSLLKFLKEVVVEWQIEDVEEGLEFLKTYNIEKEEI